MAGVAVDLAALHAGRDSDPARWDDPPRAPGWVVNGHCARTAAGDPLPKGLRPASGAPPIHVGAGTTPVAAAAPSVGGAGTVGPPAGGLPDGLAAGDVAVVAEYLRILQGDDHGGQRHRPRPRRRPGRGGAQLMAGGDPRLLWLAGDGPGDLIDQLDAVDPGSADAAAAAPARRPHGASGAGPGRAPASASSIPTSASCGWPAASSPRATRGGAAATSGTARRAGRPAGAKVAFLFPGVEPTFGVEDMDLPGLGARFGLTPPPIEDDTVAHRSASIYRIGHLPRPGAAAAWASSPDVVAGHSIGEWSGSVAAGMIPSVHADELLGVVDLSSVELPDLDFAAFSAGVDAVAPVIAELDDIVVSHDNCPGQSIVCGPPGQVDEALARLRDAPACSGYKLRFQSGLPHAGDGREPADVPRPPRADGVGAGPTSRCGRPPRSAPLPGRPGPRSSTCTCATSWSPCASARWSSGSTTTPASGCSCRSGVGSLTSFVADTLAGAATTPPWPCCAPSARRSPRPTGR